MQRTQGKTLRRSHLAYHSFVRCKSCYYPLKKLPNHRCPECGREFDPNDPSTFYQPGDTLQDLLGRQVSSWWLLVIVIVLLLGWSLVV